MSLRRGALVSVSGSSLSSVAGISVRQAFLAPAMGNLPRKRAVARYHDPVHHPCPFACLVGLAGVVRLGVRVIGAARPGLRLASGKVGLQRRLEPRVAVRGGGFAAPSARSCVAAGPGHGERLPVMGRGVQIALARGGGCF